MKSLVELLELLVLDCARKTGARVHRDVKTLRWRVEHEGDSFITITLPSFCRDFERSLSAGEIAPGLFLSFGKKQSGIPEFLQGFLCNVFGETGRLLDNPSIDCIRLVRQICLFGKKVRLECSQERQDEAIESFVQCDLNLPDPDPWMFEVFEKVCAVLTDDMDPIEALIDNPERDHGVEFLPHHGPGATQEGIFSNRKWLFQRWHSRLSQGGFPYSLVAPSCDPGNGTVRDYQTGVEIVEPWDEAPVRVCLVPKTLSSPRIIGVEPVCMQYIQQGVKDLLVKFLERNFLTAGHVNFRDQVINQELARAASYHGHLATIDMAEASDRVTVEHVQALFARRPAILRAVLACRSTRAQLPNGEIMTLRKFASMGSALCFPIEALVFYASIIASRIRTAGDRVDRRTVRLYGRDVYVYGDDLIFPTGEAPAICADLESLGFKVNARKSFWSGNFRESCGMDAYLGERVTPTYLRSMPPTDRADVAGLLSTVATCNQLYDAGYFLTSTALREAVESALGRKLPEVPRNSPAIGWHHHSEVVPRRRWNVDLQRAEILCWVPVAAVYSDPLSGWEALAKCSLTMGNSVYDRLYDLAQFARDEDHLATSVRPYSLGLKRRWVPLH